MRFREVAYDVKDVIGRTGIGLADLSSAREDSGY
jgi:hypothetical protein